MKWFTLGVISSAALAIGLATTATAVESVRFQSLRGGPTVELSSVVELSEVQIAEAAVGQFVTVEQDHPTTGTAQVVMANGQRYLVFDEAFGTATGPDVEVILYRGASVPVSIAEADYVTIAPLQSFDGAQRYLIPADLNLDSFAAVGIWCRQFNVTFGYAPLSSGSSGSDPGSAVLSGGKLHYP
ncbi:electron transfer flavoprotein [filamentous cyanobacterium CCP5]|nr:electron transfer flavoprotein [filamentous cyanobacterium CCP5]